MDLDSNIASIKSGRQVRVPGGNGEEFVSHTIAEIVGPLWGLTDVQLRRESERYIGRRIAVAGRVRDVFDVEDGGGVLILDAPLREPQVTVYLDEEEFQRLSGASMGDSLAVTGEIYKVEKLELFIGDIELIEGQ